MKKIAKYWESGLVIAVILMIGFVTVGHMASINYDMQFIYQFGDQIAKGNLPYKDFNMLQTPLALYFLGFLFKIFSAEFLLIELGELLVKIMVSFMAYWILREKNVDSKKAFLFPAAWCVMEWAAMYTDMALFFLLMAFYYVSKSKRTNRHLILCALASVLCFLSKQNIGVACGIMVMAYLAYRFLSQNADFKDIIKQAMVFLISYVTFMAGWMFFVYQNGFLNEFWEYTMFGVSDFARDISFTIICVLIYLVFIGIVVIVRKNVDLAILGVAILFCAYPLANSSHLGSASLAFFLYIAAIDSLNGVKKLMLYAGMFGALFQYNVFPFFKQDAFMIYRNIENGFIENVNKAYVKSHIEYFEGTECLAYMETVEDIRHYHFVSSIAGWYDIYFDRYDKYYDLFLKGNLGQHDPVDIVRETAQNDPESRFIVWVGEGISSCDGIKLQIPYEATEYILENFTRIDTIYQNGEEKYAVYVPQTTKSN